MLDYIPNVKFATLALASLAVLECPHTVDEKKAILGEFLDYAFAEDNALFQGVIDRINAIQVSHTLRLTPFETAIANLLKEKYRITLERGLDASSLEYQS
jgi:hypothetical protein